jgi:hypothetical protein
MLQTPMNLKPRESAPLSLSAETPKEFLRRRVFCPGDGPFALHHNLKAALVRRGFIVRSIERLESHPVWRLILHPGSARDGRERRVIQCQVSNTLRQHGYRCPPREVSAAVSGNRLVVGFVWSAGKPGLVTF